MADSLINHQDVKNHWQCVDADTNGMLGGFPHISRVDLQGSRGFLVKLGVVKRKGKQNKGSKGEDMSAAKRVADCGAGIGRITEGLLLSFAKTVDIVEPIVKFTDKLKGKQGIGEIFNVGLESWSPPQEPGYDLIWIQWCMGNLTDAQLIACLQKCRDALSEDGYVVAKENISTSGEDVFDGVDFGVTRTDPSFREIFEKAGMEIKRSEIQNGFPKLLYPVRMYALQPATRK